MENSPVGTLSQALEGFQSLVAGVTPDQWDGATPCPDWTVRQLVNHVVGGNNMVTRVLRSEQPPDPAKMPHRSGLDVLGEDPVAASQRSGADLLAALSQPDALSTPVQMPIGTVPGAVVAQMRLVEALIHGRDLAQATGQTPPFTDEIAAPALAFSKDLLAKLPGPTPMFAASTEAPPDATQTDQLAALLGRSVG